MFYAIIKNYKFKTGELKNVERLVEQTAKVLKSCWNGLGTCIFVQPVRGRWSLKSPYEKVAIFCMNPVLAMYCFFSGKNLGTYKSSVSSGRMLAASHNETHCGVTRKTVNA